MEIRSRHIGRQERPGLPALLSSPFRDAVFLWQSSNMFPSFCDDGDCAADIIGCIYIYIHPGLLNYIQLLKFCTVRATYNGAASLVEASGSYYF